MHLEANESGGVPIISIVGNEGSINEATNSVTLGNDPKPIPFARLVDGLLLFSIHGCVEPACSPAFVPKISGTTILTVGRFADLTLVAVDLTLFTHSVGLGFLRCLFGILVASDLNT